MTTVRGDRYGTGRNIGTSLRDVLQLCCDVLGVDIFGGPPLTFGDLLPELDREDRFSIVKPDFRSPSVMTKGVRLRVATVTARGSAPAGTASGTHANPARINTTPSSARNREPMSPTSSSVRCRFTTNTGSDK